LVITERELSDDRFSSNKFHIKMKSFAKAFLFEFSARELLIWRSKEFKYELRKENFWDLLVDQKEIWSLEKRFFFKAQMLMVMSFKKQILKKRDWGMRKNLVE